MAVDVEQFMQSLAVSGILTAEELHAVQETTIGTASQLAAGADQHAYSLAQELVRQDKLTPYQARLLSEGKAAGLVLGSYVVLDEIGAGGMGRVFKAQHRRMKRIVALKVLSAAAVQSEDAVRRFQREVEAAAKLTHPNIVTAFDADEEQGVHYLVMEYVEGRQLSPTAPGEPSIPVVDVLDYMLQAARGLGYAHLHGVIHRDIKPANLLLTPEGTIKILDMGLARVDEAPGAQPSLEADKLTQAGQIMGTIDFMSPEQAEDTRKADARSDIYSLGCTMYTLLTGRPLFEEETLMRKLLAHREHAVPRICAIRHDAPRLLDDILRRLVAKRPEDRYQTMEDVLHSLGDCLYQLQGASPSGFTRPGPGSGLSGTRMQAAAPPKFVAPDSDVLSAAVPKSLNPQMAIDDGSDYMLQEDAERLAQERETKSRETAAALKSGATIRVVCQCGKQFAAKKELAGKRVKCIHCGAPVLIGAPQPASDPAVPVGKVAVACQCGQRFLAKAELAGKTVKCTKCGSPLMVPGGAPNPASKSQQRITVACQCGQRFAASAASAGKTVKCTRCGAPLVIPAA